VSKVSLVKGDITEIKIGVIGHGVNCRGKMGAGVAKAIAERWPLVKEKYLTAFEANQAENLLGTVQVVEINDELIILNMFTQDRYGRNHQKYADSSAIKSCFHLAILVAKELNLPLYAPKIGCGLGGLDWESEVLPLVRIASNSHKYDVTIIEP